MRGRLGYAVTPTMLFYATGGLAYGGIATSTAVRQSLTPSLLLSADAKSDFFNNRAGWTVGGGVESALTSDLSAKLEFLYYDLGAANIAFPNSGPLIHTAVVGAGQVGDAISSSTQFNGFVVRAGLNYRFAGDQPSPNASAATPFFVAPQFVAAEKPAFGDWRVTVLPYLWALGINGTNTARGETIGTNLSFIDLLTKVDTPPLEFGTRFEARNGPFAVYGDFFWAQLRASGSALALRTPFTGVSLTADATGHLKFTVKAILEAGGAYELARWSNGGASYTAIDALAGLRYWNISANVGLDITGSVNVPALGLSQVGQLAVDEFRRLELGRPAGWRSRPAAAGVRRRIPAQGRHRRLRRRQQDQLAGVRRLYAQFRIRRPELVEHDRVPGAGGRLFAGQRFAAERPQRCAARPDCRNRPAVLRLAGLCAWCASGRTRGSNRFHASGASTADQTAAKLTEKLLNPFVKT